MITFSIIVPMYNAQRYITDCLDSVRDQTYGTYEIIVVDDGSGDSSVAIVETYKTKNKHMNIRLLKQEHKNAGAARNIGMTYATGDYLIFLDADDKFSPTLLEEIIAALDEQKGERIIVWNGIAFDDKTGMTRDVDYLLDVSYISEKTVFDPNKDSEYLFQFTTGIVWNKAFLRDFIQHNHIQFQEIERANDVCFTFTAMAMAGRIGIINKKLVFYRYNNENSLQGKNKGKTSDFYTALLETKRELEKRNVYLQYKKSFNNVCVIQCINELNARRNGDDFAFIYRNMKEYMIKTLELQKLTRESCYQLAYYEMLQAVMNKTPESFLYDEVVRLATAVNCLKEDGLKRVWPFPFAKLLPETKLVLYGAGCMGQDFARQIQESHYCDLVLWVDSDYERYQQMGFNVCAPEKICKVSFDKVLIAIKNESICNDVAQFLEKSGIDKRKII